MNSIFKSNKNEFIAAKLSDFSYENFESLKNDDFIFEIDETNLYFYQLENVNKMLKQRVFCAINKKDKQIFIVIKGSEPSFFDIENFFKDWFVSDLKMVFGSLPLNFLEFSSYVDLIKQKYSDYEVFITGHSLGGSIAQLIGAIESNSKINVFTFNAYGTKHIAKCLENYNFVIDYTAQNIKNFRVNTDIVSKKSEHIGEVYNIEYNKTLCQTIISIIKELPKLFVNFPVKVLNSVKYYIKLVKDFLKTFDSHFMNNFKEGFKYKK